MMECGKIQGIQSRADFINKLSIALKEANETRYWLKLLCQSKYITEVMYKSIKTANQGIPD